MLYSGYFSCKYSAILALTLIVILLLSKSDSALIEKSVTVSGNTTNSRLGQFQMEKLLYIVIVSGIIRVFKLGILDIAPFISVTDSGTISSSIEVFEKALRAKQYGRGSTLVHQLENFAKILKIWLYQ